MKIEKIEKELLGVLLKDFEEVKLLRVNVIPDVDFDGDDILRVEVVFEGKPKDLPAGLLTQAIRKIRPKLSEFDVFAFPMMSFISAKDAQVPTRA